MRKDICSSVGDQEGEGVIEMTEFQKRIVKALAGFPNSQASTWEIATQVFPEKWEHRSGRGALIGHIDRAGQKVGLIRLPPKDEHGEAILCLTVGAMRKSGAEYDAV